ncbi:hypothetical protein AB0M11_08660 [Streptomyces sp. NPDC051987]|uniref:hypothetical protein n=1 Tax=Streptomyces sp. NPDC051987 TaxID=3155808 RepID=UPI003439A487
MTHPGPTPYAGRPDPLATHRAPPSYQAPGLIPPSGPARTWGLVVVAAPLLLAVLLTLFGSLTGDSSGSSGASESVGSGSSGSGFFGSGTTGSGTTGSDGDGTAGDQPAYTDPTTESAWPYGDTGTPETTATDDYADPTDTATATPEAGASGGPGDVVTAYFAAISSHDYQTAWDLGGKNLDSSYDSFVSGYTTTQQDTVDIVSVTGDEVQVTIEALQTDGTTKSYDATYVVHDGEITSGTATQTG